MNLKTDVLIVGAGPVGLTMAIELARYGVGVRIIDKAPRRTDKSKALVVWSRPLELFDRSGCSAALIDAGYKADSVRISAGEKPLAHIKLEGLETKYPFALMIPQSDTERILDEFLNGLGVTVERSVEWKDFTASENSVVSSFQHADGREEALETPWLIGCDGAHSPVRHKLQKEFRGETMPIDWLLADVHLENVSWKPEIDIVWHSDGVLALFPISKDRYRVIADIGATQPDAGPRADPTLADVQTILDKRFPGGGRASNPIWLTTFRINERKVEDYRSGRVFLAGDAAHVHSPAGGQGMNTGMQDAFNLAWKLAMVVHGAGSERLLSSYSLERSPVAEQVLSVTGRATSMATMTGEAAQFLRNHTLSLVLGLAPVRKFAANVMSELSVGYPHTPLNKEAAHQEPLPGHRAPIREGEAPVGAGDAARFAVFAAQDGMPDGLLEKHSGILEPTLRRPYHSGGLWLVRPDGYVALAANAGDWDSLIGYLDVISPFQPSVPAMVRPPLE
jgi:2-polyprenyl-6-methoxyphenol hydroxylase-like FAD-dependent oxidoreductase